MKGCKRICISLFITFISFILFSCSKSTGPENTLPEIRAIRANPETIIIGQQTEVSCIALDADGDELTYQWSADAGEFEDPDSASTKWTSPEAEGMYRLKCTVSDGEGERWAYVTVFVISITVPEDVDAYWPFESGFEDYVGMNCATKGTDGPVINNDDARIGIGCAEFEGEDGDVESSILLDGAHLKMGPDDDFTFTLWINTEDEDAFIFGKTFNGNYIAEEGDQIVGAKGLMLGGGTLYFDMWGIGGAEGEDPINDGEWHLAAVVKSGMHLTIYVDGEVYAESDMEEWSLDGETVITMGAGSEEGDTWPGTYCGLMDDVRFYQKALTSEDIEAIYNGEK